MRALRTGLACIVGDEGDSNPELVRICRRPRRPLPDPHELVRLLAGRPAAVLG
ncbi:hypothetical protein FHS23_004328 [Prauserella isguenensis]|uniref:Uncharacterized protein n=1 Tax=Prauserella isguenensis TaxID=1470180 RepID=A0A839S7E6_9PSEU|nr:hypothetical protein [Prauserella isguenensis]MBB3053284.1 hypothetical protein [Prauserella isguenensis]